MIKLVFCCHRQPHLNRQEFQRYWRDEHGGLVRSLRAQLPQMRRYVQSHALDDPINDLIREGRGTGESYDGIAEVWFDDVASMGGTGEDGLAVGQRLLEDEATFLDLPRCSLFLTEEFEIF